MVQSIFAKRKIGKARLLFALRAICPLLAAMILIPASASAASPGEWKEKTEILWDADAGKLVRRSFRAFDQHPELGLEFEWLPATESGKGAGPITGEGKLIWYRAGASPYDYASRYSIYEGSLEGGLPDGWGKLKVRLGLSYEGQWKDGLMQGFGWIAYATGERYQGNFVGGKPDGSGSYIAPDGKVRESRTPESESGAAGPTPQSPTKPRIAEAASTVGTDAAPSPIVARAKVSAPIPLALIPLGPGLPPAAAGRRGKIQVAAASAPLAMSIYVDRAMNDKFKEADSEFEGFVYDQAEGADIVEIRLDAPDIMARWKGDGAITADADQSLVTPLDPNQFAPVFLVIDVVNEGDHAAQITGGYIEVAESVTEWEPYLEISSIEYFAVEETFDPTFAFINQGWGPVHDARVTYSFGQPGAGGQTFTIDAGTFDQSQEVSTLPGFQASGVNVEAVKTGKFSCPSEEQVPSCLADLVQTGIFGQLGGAVFSEYKHVYTQVNGVIDYGWLDAAGALQQRQSPISIKLPVLDFVIGPVAEFGAGEAINRNLPAIKLGLDQQNYRIPFSYRGAIAAQANQRFAMTLDADRSSHHRFRVVLQLADGSAAATPPVDLLMFRPRSVTLY